MTVISVAHGGVGSENQHSDGPQRAVVAVAESLSRREKPLDVAVDGVVILEDDPRFDAGTGSWLRLNGKIEMDAAVMDSNGNFGAVAGIKNVKNPVKVARCILDSPHVFLCGEGATRFARAKGFPYYNPSTSEARKRFKEAKTNLARKNLPYGAKKWKTFDRSNMGCDTVGVVLYDGQGHFAAAGSTGGTLYSLPGRVGDTPMIGCGIYVGKHAAVVATGVGEEIIKKQLAWVVYAKIQSGQSPQRACRSGLKLFPKRLQIGVIAVSRNAYGIAVSHQMAVAILKK